MFDTHNYQSISNLETKRILLRACLNVETDGEGRMIDATRFYDALPLIRELAVKAKSLVIMAHLGRPKTKEKKYSFWHVAERLQEELPEIKIELVKNVQKFPPLEGEGKGRVTKSYSHPHLNPPPSRGRKVVYLLENIRFFPAEESKNLEERMAFAKQLATLGDVFINDAFPDYRASASTYDVATILPSYLGPLFMSEVESLQKCKSPVHPFIAVLGGAKLSEKLDTLLALLPKADKVLVGGAMAYTLLKAQNITIGHSLFEPEKLAVAQEILEKHGSKIILPIDHVVTDKFEENAPTSIWNTTEIPAEKLAIDIGPKTIELYSQELAKAAAILWNGPMGVFEWQSGEKGTRAIGASIVQNIEAFKLTGGGDTIAAINKFHIQGLSHISTGGGAMLYFLAHDDFPTLDVITGK